MTRIEIPETKFRLHRPGRFTGFIIEVEHRGMQETPFGNKLKLSTKLECESAKDEDGKPYTIYKWFTISGHPKSALVKFRTMMLGRALTPMEITNLDPGELVGKRCGYQVVHVERDGTTYANIEQLWPVDDAPKSSDEEDLPF